MFATANHETPLDKSERNIRKKFKDPLLLDFLNKCWEPNPDSRATASELLDHQFLIDTKDDK